VLTARIEGELPHARCLRDDQRGIRSVGNEGDGGGGGLSNLGRLDAHFLGGRPDGIVSAVKV